MRFRYNFYDSDNIIIFKNKLQGNKGWLIGIKS